jgi:hypothetical protein
VLAFLTASGYAGASVLYGLGNPPFIHDGYTIGIFDVGGLFLANARANVKNDQQLPTFVANNGSVIANTTATKSIPNCQPVSVS